MSKDYFVLRGGRVVYKPGHYDQEGAEKVAMHELSEHPKATVQVVQVVRTWQNPPEKGKRRPF